MDRKIWHEMAKEMGLKGTEAKEFIESNLKIERDREDERVRREEERLNIERDRENERVRREEERLNIERDREKERARIDDEFRRAQLDQQLRDDEYRRAQLKLREMELIHNAELEREKHKDDTITNS